MWLLTLILHEAEVDVSRALRDELVVCENRKRGAAQMFARGTIDQEQLETISAELDQRMGEIRAGLNTATAHSPLSPFTMTDDAEADLGRAEHRPQTRNRPDPAQRDPPSPLGRGHCFNRDLIQIGRSSTPAPHSSA